MKLRLDNPVHLVGIAFAVLVVLFVIGEFPPYLTVPVAFGIGMALQRRRDHAAIKSARASSKAKKPKSGKSGNGFGPLSAVQ